MVAMGEAETEKGPVDLFPAERRVREEEAGPLARPGCHIGMYYCRERTGVRSDRLSLGL